MKISMAQTNSAAGDIESNINKHLEIIKLAVKAKSNLIIFPELSITGYEPALVDKLAFEVNDPRFNIFQQFADNYDITIGIGAPIRTSPGIKIGIIFFRPNENRMLYSKNYLHSDELEHFVPGDENPILQVFDKRIALAICYELTVDEHLARIKAGVPAIYIASVAKSPEGVNSVFGRLSKIALECSFPVLLCNCVGECEDFTGGGKSAVWDKNGQQIAELDNKEKGLLIYDTEKGEVNKLTLAE